MKKIRVIVFLLLTAGALLSAGEGTGAAVIIGVPSGLNFKAWLSPSSAINVNFGINPLNSWTYMNLDVLYHFRFFYRAPVYTGGGVKVEINGSTKSSDNINSGLRFLAGDEIFFNPSFSFFIEGGYVFQFLPFTLEPGYNVSAGLRYYLTHS